MRQATPSPATWPFCERRRPFFLKTKLEPMRRPLEMAKRIPTIWRRREEGELRLAGRMRAGSTRLTLRLLPPTLNLPVAVEEADAAAEVDAAGEGAMASN